MSVNAFNRDDRAPDLRGMNRPEIAGAVDRLRSTIESVRHRCVPASFIALGVLSMWAASAGCGASSKPPGEQSSSDGVTSRGDASAFLDTGVVTGTSDDGGTTEPRCPVETQFVHVIDADGTLYRFDPPTDTFTKTGPISCPGSVYSMAVDRSAFAYVLFQSGELMHVDTRDGSCTPTSFVPNQNGFSTVFGMGFSSDTANGTSETLYVSSPSAELGRIDIKTMNLTDIGAYDKLAARAELTGTGDARLFGAFEGVPYTVAEIDKSSAAILDQAPQSGVNASTGASNFAFAFWGGDFYLFEGPGTSTAVYHYSPTKKTTTPLKTESFVIVGAGVSTCAPTTAPK